MMDQVEQSHQLIASCHSLPHINNIIIQYPKHYYRPPYQIRIGTLGSCSAMILMLMCRELKETTAHMIACNLNLILLPANRVLGYVNI